MGKTCAFTGHRPARLPWRYNEASEKCKILKEAIHTETEKLISRGFTLFLSGMALGCDTFFAETVLDLRKNHPQIDLFCIVACRDQDSKWPMSAQDRFHRVLKQAQDVQYVSSYYTPSCTLDRDVLLVTQADAVLAVFDGIDEGGTAYTIRKARSIGKPIIRINPVTDDIIHEGKL